MFTISLELSDELRLRVCKAAAGLGIDTQAFMLSAIRQAVEEMEQPRRLAALAKAARSDLLQGGRSYSASEVRAYLRARLANAATSRLAIKPWHE